MQLSKKQQGGLLAGGLVGAAVVSWLTSDSEPDHDELLEEAYNAVDSATDGSVAISSDHGVGNGEGIGSIDGIEGVPDMAVTSFGGPSLLVEVETPGALADRTADVIEQINGFQKQGYKRVLVVPSEATDAAVAVADDIGGKVTVSTPSGVAQLL
ncbi:hypothetical protein halTADL_1203 [Halohasta litchfieldiae]|jgi:hypothetical protein|uniref:Uncharacterized protein n=1 Tax=Halohasta litchfieldiae TaxID=1073996 RepID=A0A1H6WQ23_9EURY|nr:hypothetical protein [Halohasta litchfieldiae]ATW87992.1 hypothetical protein halTADL_1203 [Halohasta litchfieldiae]SEJ19131.1 hypothetical protein SAMN05444271_12922 [Halohasta litchfieldiae]